MKSFAYDIKIVIEPDDYGYYAYCPGLPGIFACGKTEEEALINAKDGAISILRTKLGLREIVQENENLKIVPVPRDENRLNHYRTQINFPLTVSL